MIPSSPLASWILGFAFIMICSSVFWIYEKQGIGVQDQAEQNQTALGTALAPGEEENSTVQVG